MGIIRKDIKEPKALIHIECLETAFFEISSVISAHRDLNTILEVIVRESLHCLKANRCSIFIMDEENGTLKVQSTYASDSFHKQLGLHEEREVAQKTLKQNKPSLLGGPRDFSDFFKYEERERKITSLMSIPLSSGEKTMGVLSVVLINEEYGFDEKSLQLFFSFANLASIAMQMVDLHEEVSKAKGFRSTYERYLDNMLSRLQGLSEKEPQPVDRQIAEIPVEETEQRVDEKEFYEGQDQEKVAWVKGTITLKEESGIDRRKDERVETIVRVEFDEECWGFTKNLSKGGASILTPDPMELGDEFFMKLHMPDGEEPIEVACKVVWTNKYSMQTHDMRRGMGIKFSGLRPGVQKRIGEYIKSKKKPSIEKLKSIDSGSRPSKKLQEHRLR
jgi:Tfp pilus assembly protein PilZ